MNNFLFKPVSNAPLVLFRVVFGLLIFAESLGAILTGWVRTNLVEPSFSFTFIGFEWLNVLLGPQMYVYFSLMAIWGIMVMLGYRYRFAMIAFSIMWLGAYLIQKTSYNNHYYLLVWINFLMIFLPANRYLSLDVKWGRIAPQSHMYNWHRWAPIVLMGIAYVFGSIAKIYPDWLDATFINRAFTNRYENPSINALFSASWFHYFISYTGIIFDGLIVFALLFKPTRTLALIASVVFHIFNSVVFEIGIFPYLSLGFILFFYPPEWVKEKFLKSQPDLKHHLRPAAFPKLTTGILVATTVFHLLVPLRHRAIDSNVFWTEEGHRMSWRMMLRSKSGTIYYKVVDKETGKGIPFKIEQYLTAKQLRGLPTHPDMIWQFAQFIHRDFEKKQLDVAVYAVSRVSLNGRPYAPFTKTDVDLAQEPWRPFEAATWLHEFPGWEKR